MSTLLITYLPKGDSSNTKRLVDRFLQNTVQDTEIIHHELSENIPEMMVKDNLFAYMKRAFRGQELTTEEKTLLSVADHHAQQLVEADNIVIASPIHNFGAPGIVKVWLDNVVQKGITFDYGANGPVGLMKNKKALVLYTAGFWYKPGYFDVDWNTYPELMTANLTYMGYDPVTIVGVDGVNSKDKDALEQDYETAFKHIDDVAKEWLK